MREIKEGDFVILNRKIGYTAMACSDAMEVMEVHKGGLTAKCTRDGCMTKPLSDECMASKPRTNFELKQ